MTEARYHIIVKGRVQGVFYRSNTRRNALELGLNGWVKNLPDGRVEIVVEGEEDQIDKLIQWCRVGPPLAVVRELRVECEPATREFSSFQIRR